MSLADIKHAMKGNNHESLGTRIGLYIDPLHYLSKLWGGQKNYDAFVNKSGDFLNKQASSVAKPIDKFARKYDPLHKKITSTEGGDKAATWIVNKPATTAGAIYGGIAGGSALAGGGAASGGSSVGLTPGGGALSSDAALGAATNAGVGTFGAGAGSGTLGGLGGAAVEGLPEIVVTGTPAGIGGEIASGAVGAGAATTATDGNGKSWKDYTRQFGQQNGQRRQQEPYQGRMAELEHERQQREAEDLARRRRLVAALQQQGMGIPNYSPAALPA